MRTWRHGGWDRDGRQEREVQPKQTRKEMEGAHRQKKNRYMDKQKQNSGDESTDQLEQTCSAFWRLELASETQ